MEEVPFITQLTNSACVLLNLSLSSLSASESSKKGERRCTACGFPTLFFPALNLTNAVLTGDTPVSGVIQSIRVGRKSNGLAPYCGSTEEETALKQQLQEEEIVVALSVFKDFL